MSTPIPESVRAGLRALRADLAAGELVTALTASSIDVLLLRGPAIARRLYRDGERGYGDADLLVPEGERGAVEAALEALGYGSYTPGGVARHWYRPGDDAEVDLHSSLWGVLGPASALWTALSSRRETIELRGVEVPVPGPGGTAFVVVLHALQHGGTAEHPLADLARAVDRFGSDIWADAAACADETCSLLSFRRGLTLLPTGRELLETLGLEPATSRQSELRMRGIRVPEYLFEGLSPRERLAILRRRIVPGRSEMTALVDPRAANGTGPLLAAHARRMARVPGRMLRLAAVWPSARRRRD